MWLLDGNLLVALILDTHPYYRRARNWFAAVVDSVATCSVTEGTFLRLHLQLAADNSATTAWSTLAKFQSNPDHIFLDDGFNYQNVSPRGLLGHKQVTDAWLAEFARRHGAQLATLDAGLVATHPDVSFLVPEFIPS